MKEITEVKLSRASGYVDPEYGYTDELILNRDGIAYTYKPFLEKEDNARRHWEYRTDSPVFASLFEKTCQKLNELMEKPPRGFLTADIGSFYFRISFAEEEDWEYYVSNTPDPFEDCFSFIRKMVPGCEYVPSVLRRYEEDLHTLMSEAKES